MIATRYAPRPRFTGEHLNGRCCTLASVTPAPAPTLLSPATLARLERLEVVSRKVFRGKVKGERISRRKGQSVEFADFRNYVPGDDLRLIDWNLYARLDQLFLKLFQEEEDLHVHVLVDASASMGFGTPTKLHLAKQTAAAIGYIGLCRGDRVSARAMGPAGHRAPVVRSRAAAARLIDYLTSIQPDQNITLLDAVKDFLIRGASPGVVVLITDLMDKSGYESALRLLVGRRMDVVVVQILSDEELDPPLRGDRRLIDIEDGDAAEITIGDVALRRYRATLESFLAGAKSFCSRRGIVHLMVPGSTPIESVMIDYLRARGVVA